MATVAQHNVAIQLEMQKLRRQMGQMDRMVRRQAKSTFGAVGNLASGVFGGITADRILQTVIQVGFQADELADKFEGVAIAFNSLDKPIGLMDELKGATGGVVTELELMQRVVQASNFEIDLKALPDLLEFARVRARSTGQEVDVLVDKIVTGIGRKSPLIIDDLGISTSRLKKEMQGLSLAEAEVGDVAAAVARIINQEMGKVPETLRQNASSTENLQRAWAEFITSEGLSFKPQSDDVKNNLAGLLDYMKEWAPKARTALLSAFTPAGAASAIATQSAKQAIQNTVNSGTATPYTGPFQNAFGGGQNLSAGSLNFGGFGIQQQSLFRTRLNNAVQQSKVKFPVLDTLEQKSLTIKPIMDKIIDEINRLKDQTLEGGSFGDNLKLFGDGLPFGLDSSNNLGRQAAERLDANVKPVKLAENMKKISSAAKETINALPLLGRGFQSVFDVAINGADSTADAILSIATSIIPTALSFIPGVGPIASSLFGGLSSVTRGGDIRHSGALTSRRRRYRS